ncbi:hypothetical protein K523DRAFT_358696 [Schizophyllum commune Tattone D]|nr:hypothetical protein K523DRAFT_358696 [Schizophyllum commune Tattone D]
MPPPLRSSSQPARVDRIAHPHIPLPLPLSRGHGESPSRRFSASRGMCCSLPSIELGMPRTQPGDSWQRFLRTHPTPPDPSHPVLRRKGLKGLGYSSSRRVRALATRGYGGEVKHVRSRASSCSPRSSRAPMPSMQRPSTFG